MTDLTSHLTPKQAAAKVGVTPMTISRWLRKRKLRGFRLEGRWLIPPDAIQEMVDRARARREEGGL